MQCSVFIYRRNGKLLVSAEKEQEQTGGYSAAAPPVFLRYYHRAVSYLHDDAADWLAAGADVEEHLG